MSKSKILKCTCKHEFQDATYGKEMRVHNLNKDAVKGKCSVCNNIRDAKA